MDALSSSAYLKVQNINKALMVRGVVAPVSAMIAVHKLVMPNTARTRKTSFDPTASTMLTKIVLRVLRARRIGYPHKTRPSNSVELQRPANGCLGNS